ncbi:MAG TPA: 4-alpha-glucanotransferase [Bryobacteraceae bacterium]|nr:4-alpha-glucanotransferase [Bryobacteraceae bacterium]
MKKEHFVPSSNYAQALGRAALLWGTEPEYGDTWGKVHITPDETKKGILKALGVPVETREALDRAVEERLTREWDRLTPPVAVIGASAFGRGFPVHLPEELANAALTVELKWEDGGTARRTIAVGELKDDAYMSIGRRNWVRKLVPVPADAPLGYHSAEVVANGRNHKQLSSHIGLILCPDRCYEPAPVRDGNRAAGIAVALYGLRSQRNWGCGDFTDLEPLADWLAEDARASFIGLNPLHAIPNRQPFNISPYLPASTFYKNPIYLDLERIGPFQRCPVAQRWFASESVRSEIESLRAAEFVEYERVWSLKLTGLKHAFARFLSENDLVERRAFDTWRTGEGDLLERYALWAALDEWLHKQDPNVWVWTQWPEQYREPDSPAVREFARVHERRVLFYEWLQWETDRQLERAQQYALHAGLSIGLYHDLALATDQFGSDLWAWRPFYVSGCRVGAPPDGFSPKGQDWAFPPPDTEHHRETAYQMFADSIRNNARHGGALRMDHVMRFFRLYWIPKGLEPDSGAYVRDHYEDLLHILALESVRNRVIMIGEDLGTVTDEIRHALDRFGVCGYKVPYFEKWQNGALKMPEEYTAQAIVSSSTHDLPTLAGFWIGKDIEARRVAGLVDESSVRNMWAERARDKQLFLDALFRKHLLPEWFPRRADQIPELTGELHNAFVGWLAQAPSRLMALNQEDLLKDAEQQNLPATNADQYPNWMHKMRFTVEELRTAGYARDVTAMFRGWLERTGRVNRSSIAEHA